jgi:acetyl esterase/lipase
MTTENGSTDRAGAEVTRFIPVPTTVSDEAQQFLTLGLELLAGGRPEEPALDDLDGWRAHTAAVNEMVGAVLGSGTDSLAMTVETMAVDDVPVYVVTPDGLADDPDQPIYLDIHGGGFTMGFGPTCVVMAKRMTSQVGMKVWSVDYRMPPDHPYPAALDDCLAVYRRLLEDHPPERVVVGGASAGGNLAGALMLRARDEGLPMPAALVLLTPEADLTESGDTFATNLGIDSVLTSSLATSIALYADGHDLTDPYLSPLFGTYSPSFPPTLLQSGTRDLFLSNTVRLHRKLRAAGVDAELHVFEAMPHGGFFGAPEDDEIGVEVRRFIAAHLR